VSGFVELCGAPGSGKTTLMRALSGSRADRAPGSPLRLIGGDRLWLRTRPPLRPFLPALALPAVQMALARSPLLSRILLRAEVDEVLELWRRSIDAGSPRGPSIAAAVRTEVLALEMSGELQLDAARGAPHYRRRVDRWLEETLAAVALADALPSGLVAVLDEAGVQRSISLVGAEASDAHLARILGLIPRPLALVHLSVDPEVMDRRTADRLRDGRAPVLQSGRSDEEAIASVRRDAVAIRRAVAIVRELGTPVLELDAPAQAAPDDAARTVRAFLEELGR